MQQYILNYKIKMVESRLLHSEMRISEIVEELGFTDESHLNRLFKKYKDCNPTDFRKKHRGGISSFLAIAPDVSWNKCYFSFFIQNETINADPAVRVFIHSLHPRLCDGIRL